MSNIFANVDRMSTGAKLLTVAIGLLIMLAYSLDNQPAAQNLVQVPSTTSTPARPSAPSPDTGAASVVQRRPTSRVGRNAHSVANTVTSNQKGAVAPAPPDGRFVSQTTGTVTAPAPPSIALPSSPTAPAFSEQTSAPALESKSAAKDSEPLGSAPGMNRLRTPANASLDYSGHSWVCNRGYAPARDGTCVAVSVPANASLDYSGHSWVCNRGYVQIGAECKPANQ